MPVATLKVRSDSASPRPSKERVDQAAMALSARGFKVVHKGRFGVSVEAHSKNLADLAGVSLKDGTSFVAPIQSADQALTSLFESLEVEPDPQLY